MRKHQTLLLVNGKRQHTFMTAQDVFGTGVPTCIVDNIGTFTSDLKLIVDEGQTKCSPGDPQTTTGTYSLNSGNTQLTTSIAGISEVFNIIIL